MPPPSYFVHSYKTLILVCESLLKRIPISVLNRNINKGLTLPENYHLVQWKETKCRLCMSPILLRKQRTSRFYPVQELEGFLLHWWLVFLYVWMIGLSEYITLPCLLFLASFWCHTDHYYCCIVFISSVFLLYLSICLE